MHFQYFAFSTPSFLNLESLSSKNVLVTFDKKSRCSWKEEFNLFNVFSQFRHYSPLENGMILHLNMHKTCHIEKCILFPGLPFKILALQLIWFFKLTFHYYKIQIFSQMRSYIFLNEDCISRLSSGLKVHRST